MLMRRQNKKNFLPIKQKVNEGDEKNKQKQTEPGKKNSLKINLFFFEMFFYLPKLTVFSENRQQSNARAGQKKRMFFGG